MDLGLRGKVALVTGATIRVDGNEHRSAFWTMRGTVDAPLERAR